MCVSVCACVYARAIGCGQTGAGEKKRDLNESEFFRSETDSRNLICRNPNLNRALRQRKEKNYLDHRRGSSFWETALPPQARIFFLPGLPELSSSEPGLERNIRLRLGFRLKALPKILGSVIRSTKVNKDPFLGSKVLFSFLLAGPSSKRTWTDSMKNRIQVKSRPTATTSAANSRL